MGRTAIILTMLVAAAQILPGQTVTVNSDDPTTMIVSGASASESEAIKGAADRFRLVGLSLPPLEITLHASAEGCHGSKGRYTPGTEIDRIDLCTTNEFIVLHELAHAWEHRFASDAAREQLLEDRGLDAWTGHDVQYRKRGIEVAANLVAWGLVDAELTEVDLLYSAHTREGFLSLTGVPSPRTAASNVGL